MIPYGQHHITQEDVEAVTRSLRGDRITQGQKVDEFEAALREFFGCEHAVAVNNGTTALHLAYKALGVEDGDQVLTTPNTFVATSNAVLYNEGTPRFVDIDASSYNLDVDRLEKFLSDPENRENVAGIAPVHFAGLPCDMEKISELAERYDLFVLEDACHAPGAEWCDSNDRWHKVGDCSHGDAAVLSFHPVKHFTTGEGGAVLTNEEDLAESIRALRHHGITRNQEQFSGEPDGPWDYEMQELGINGRITDIQCALGISQLERLEETVRKRRELANDYRNELSDVEGLVLPEEGSSRKHSYHLYVVRSEYRDDLYDHLRDDDIGAQVHYIPVYDQPYYQENLEVNSSNYPRMEAYYEQALSLPMFPRLSQDDFDHVIESIKTFHRDRSGS